jgi:hypothetical protein
MYRNSNQVEALHHQHRHFLWRISSVLPSCIINTKATTMLRHVLCASNRLLAARSVPHSLVHFSSSACLAHVSIAIRSSRHLSIALAARSSIHYGQYHRNDLVHCHTLDTQRRLLSTTTTTTTSSSTTSSSSDSNSSNGQWQGFADVDSWGAPSTTAPSSTVPEPFQSTLPPAAWTHLRVSATRYNELLNAPDITNVLYRFDIPCISTDSVQASKQASKQTAYIQASI